MSVPSNPLSSQADSLLADAEQATIFRIATAGSVDVGKSTLIGRLLHDSKSVYQDQLNEAHATATKKDPQLMLSLLIDGLQAEREQGITIDVAYRYFSTSKRRFILADTPGHERYTRNMVTGASTADAALVLIDAGTGITMQTKRHSCIASLLAVPRLLVVVNKMDSISFDEQLYEEIIRDYQEFARHLQIKELSFFPVSALGGDNVVHRSSKTPWYKGPALLEHLETLYFSSDENRIDFRFPVQHVIRTGTYRGYAGRIASGGIKVGEEVIALPSMQKSRIKSIDFLGPENLPVSAQSAPIASSITLTLEDDLDISRGEMLARPLNLPRLQHEVDGMLVWMDEAPAELQQNYIFQHGTRKIQGRIACLRYQLEVETLSRLQVARLECNAIGRVSIKLQQTLAFDAYRNNRATGCMIVIDPLTFKTVGALMLLDHGMSLDLDGKKANESGGNSTQSLPAIQKQQSACTIWMTGLSGAGKTTLAQALVDRLLQNGTQAHVLDGDTLRAGLNKDLGFDLEDRAENIRRSAHVAAILNQAGITVICALISPLEKDRQTAKSIIGEDSFIEVWVSTPLVVCEKRDVKGMYKKARRGEISHFTGIDSPYEGPVAAHLEIDTSNATIEESLTPLLLFLASRK